MKTEDWIGPAIVVAGMAVALIIAELSKRAEARRRTKERAEDRRRELEMWELGRPAREREALRRHRAKYVELAKAIGSMPQPIADAIADIDQQLAAIKAEQIRKMTEAAQP